MGATILQDLVAIMVIAAAVTILFYRLKQPVVLGYLLAGALMGPHLIGLIKDANSVGGLAELGLIFLMFGVGLEFDLRKLRRVGLTATIAALFQIAVMMGLGYLVGTSLGWSFMDSIVLGGVISISSTVIIVKVLAEMGKLKEEFAELAIGILIVEDIAAIVMVALLTSIGVSGSFGADLIGATVGGVMLFIFVFVAVGLVLVPRLIESVSRFQVEEVLVITVVGLAFMAALLAMNLGLSLALGAFLMGCIIAESKAVKRVEHKIVPIRDLFVAVFFVAVGMLIDPAVLAQHWWPILLITLVTIVGKVLAVGVGSFLVGYDGRTSVKTGASLGQIGEFSFILAGLGLSLGIIRPELHPISVAVCAITSLTTPTLIRRGPQAAEAIAPRIPAWFSRAAANYQRAARKVFSRRRDPLAQTDAARKRHGKRVAIYAAWLFGLLLMAAYMSQWLGGEVGERLSLGDNATRTAAIGFLGLASLPLFVAFTKATENYTFAAAKAKLMSPHTLSGRQGLLNDPKFVARVVAGLAAIVLVTLATRVAWGVHPLAVPNLWLLIPVLLLVGAVGFFAWHKLEHLYHAMEKTLNGLMGETGEHHDDDRNHKLRERLPFGMDLEEVIVHPHGRAAFANLKSLNLREKTGATVLSIERGSSVVPNPHPALVLLPRDRVILVGKRDHLDAAAGFLNAYTPHDPSFMAADIRVPASSPAVGHALGDLHLGDAGATPGLIRKRDGTYMAPSDRVALEPDDHIFVYGPEASIDATRERLRLRTFPEPSARRGPAR